MTRDEILQAALEDAAYYDYITDTEADDEEDFDECAEEDWQHEREERHGFEQV